MYRKLSATGAALAVDLLEGYPDLPAATPYETTEADYHGVPGPEARRTFLERGNRFF